jgi:hypothetical protein
MKIEPTYVFLTWEDISYSRTGVIYSGLKRYGSKPVLHQITLRNIYIMSLQVRKILKSSEFLNPVLVVGSPCGLLVLAARLASPKARIVFDTGWPQVDALKFKMDKSGKNFLRYLKMYLLDFASFRMSNLIAVESKAQKTRLTKIFLVSPEKLFVSYTGLNEEEFINNQLSSKRGVDESIVIFRGKVNSEAGIELLAEISWLLPGDLKLIVISQNIPTRIVFSTNTEIVSERISNSQLADYYGRASLAIGQLGNSRRINFTIPHKFYEASFFGIPYLTCKTDALSELISFDEFGLFLEKIEAISVSSLITAFVRNKEKQISARRYLGKSYRNSFSQEIITTDFKDHTAKYF